MIREVKSGSGGKFILMSKDGTRKLGEVSYTKSSTRDSAKKRILDREREVEYFKHKGR